MLTPDEARGSGSTLPIILFQLSRASWRKRRRRDVSCSSRLVFGYENSKDSGVLASTPYSFKTRFENEKGTNPEELIAAAHAGCFTMALAFGLQTAGFNP